MGISAHRESSRYYRRSVGPDLEPDRAIVGKSQAFHSSPDPGLGDPSLSGALVYKLRPGGGTISASGEAAPGGQLQLWLTRERASQA